MSRRLDLDDVLRIVRRVIEVSEARGEPLGTPIVLIGGSAMAAHGIRERSVDVDLYAPALSADAVHDVEMELASSYGDAFRIDATSTENLWGTILVRDVTESPMVGTIETPERTHEVRALRIEDLYLLKLAADRLQDRRDLPLLAARTSADALVSRFNRLVGWHGDPGAVMGFADAFLRRLHEDFGTDPRVVIDRLAVPAFVAAELRDSWHDG